jgi:hypothetical protein
MLLNRKIKKSAEDPKGILNRKIKKSAGDPKGIRLSLFCPFAKAMPRGRGGASGVLS